MCAMPKLAAKPGRNRKRVAFFPAHPSQVWMLDALARELGDDIEACWFGRRKDITLELMQALGLNPIAASRGGTGLAGNLAEYVRNLGTCMAQSSGIDLWISKYGAANMAGRFSGTPTLSFNDDDADVVPFIAWTSYPFATFTLTPRRTRMGRFESRALRYDGYHELFYLHPRRFAPDAGIFGELGLPPDTPYALVRLSALNSHHDMGVRGLGDELLREVIALCGRDVRVFVTSEKPLRAELEAYRFPIAPARVHHALAHAQFIVGDSQTMTAEAAVLGTPALRINDFVGRISYLADLEQRGLTYGFRPGEEALLLERLGEILSQGRAPYAERRLRLIAETIDPVPWFAEIIRRMLAGEAPADIRQAAEASGRAGG